MRYLRTPEERFADLPDFPFVPRHVDVPAGDGTSLRMAYVDEGPRGADPVLMLHGEPSWSFLYRRVIDRVAKSGRLAVAPDLIGFGRSDKPALRSDYTFQRHVDWLAAFIDKLELRRITLLCQDWGGLLGLRLVAEDTRGRFDRVVAANTGLPTGDRPPAGAFLEWRIYSQEVPELRASEVVRRYTVHPPRPEVLAAYDAPFPDASYQAGARQFPMLVPATPDDPAAPANRRAWESLTRFEKPFLTLFSDGDPMTAGVERLLQKKIPGAAGQPHRVLEGGGHFLQEDVPDELSSALLDFLEKA